MALRITSMWRITAISATLPAAIPNSVFGHLLAHFLQADGWLEGV
jgi:hypothetical protein